MGRPKKKIDEEGVRKLAEKQWSYEMIGAFFGVSHQTIMRRYGRIVEESRQEGKSKIVDLLWMRATSDKSDKILTHLADRFLGPIPKKIEITREQAIEVLEKELEREGTDTAALTSGEETE